MVKPQKPSIDELNDLMVQLILPFRHVMRDTVVPLEPRQFENDVEHSWSVAMLACSLAPEVDKTLDVGKIAQYSIVHDLVELYAKDTSPWHDAETRASKEQREEAALRRIVKDFSRFSWLTTTVSEYEARDTPEAKFVWAVDKIIIMMIRYLDHGRFYIETGITKQLWDERLTGHRKKAHAHPEIGDYYEQLLELFEAHPEYFASEPR